MFQSMALCLIRRRYPFQISAGVATIMAEVVYGHSQTVQSSSIPGPVCHAFSNFSFINDPVTLHCLI